MSKNHLSIKIKHVAINFFIGECSKKTVYILFVCTENYHWVYGLIFKSSKKFSVQANITKFSNYIWTLVMSAWTENFLWGDAIFW